MCIIFCLLFCWLAPSRENPYKNQRIKDMGTIKGVVKENLTALPSSTGPLILDSGTQTTPLRHLVHNPEQHNCLSPKSKSSARLLCCSQGDVKTQAPSSLLTHHRQHLTPKGSRAPPGHTSPQASAQAEGLMNCLAFKALHWLRGLTNIFQNIALSSSGSSALNP